MLAAIAVALAMLIVGPSVPDDDYEKSVRPILERRCQPCHFAGGKMYERLPFDREATVLKLRERLFTRIKDEAERAAIRGFIARHTSKDES